MSVKRISRKCPYDRYDFLSLLSCGDHSYFVPKLIGPVGFPFGNATSKRLVKAAKFILVFFLLIYGPLVQFRLFPVLLFLLFTHFPLQFPYLCTGYRLQPFLCLLRFFGSLGMCPVVRIPQ